MNNMRTFGLLVALATPFSNTFAGDFITVEDYWDFLLHDISGDGSVMVGNVRYRPPGENVSLIVGTISQDSEIRVVDPNTPGPIRADTTRTSYNGDYIGAQFESDYAIYRWDSSAGYYVSTDGVSDHPGLIAMSNDGNTQTVDVSSDGTVLAGNILGPSTQGFVWSEDSGIQGVGYLNADHDTSSIERISADGSTAIGYSWASSDGSFLARSDFATPYIWSETGGMTALSGFSDRTSNINITDISGDGSVVVGSYSEVRTYSSGSDYTHSEAFVWSEDQGLISLRDLLRSQDVIIDISDGYGGTDGWHFLEGDYFISDDGNWVAGVANHGEGGPWNFFANIDPNYSNTSPVPEPPLYFMMLVGLFGVLIRAQLVDRNNFRRL